jgi:predicted nucleotidyltransferase
MRENVDVRVALDKSTIIAKLRENEPSLKAAGIVHLQVHGSIVRDEATAFSDVDLIADFARSKKLSLLARINLENRLTDILGVRADLADREMLRPEVLERAQRESILVF